MIEFQGVLMQQRFFLSLTYKVLSQNYPGYNLWGTSLLSLLFLLTDTFRLLWFFKYYVVIMR